MLSGKDRKNIFFVSNHNKDNKKVSKFHLYLLRKFTQNNKFKINSENNSVYGMNDYNINMFTRVYVDMFKKICVFEEQ